MGREASDPSRLCVWLTSLSLYGRICPQVLRQLLEHRWRLRGVGAQGPHRKPRVDLQVIYFTHAGGAHLSIDLSLSSVGSCVFFPPWLLLDTRKPARSEVDYPKKQNHVSTCCSFFKDFSTNRQHSCVLSHGSRRVVLASTVSKQRTPAKEASEECCN